MAACRAPGVCRPASALFPLFPPAPTRGRRTPCAAQRTRPGAPWRGWRRSRWACDPTDAHTLPTYRAPSNSHPLPCLPGWRLRRCTAAAPPLLRRWLEDAVSPTNAVTWKPTRGRCRLPRTAGLPSTPPPSFPRVPLCVWPHPLSSLGQMMSRVYSPKSDVYMFGVCLFELVRRLRAHASRVCVGRNRFGCCGCCYCCCCRCCIVFVVGVGVGIGTGVVGNVCACVRLVICASGDVRGLAMGGAQDVRHHRCVSLVTGNTVVGSDAAPFCTLFHPFSWLLGHRLLLLLPPPPPPPGGRPGAGGGGKAR